MKYFFIKGHTFIFVALFLCACENSKPNEKSLNTTDSQKDTCCSKNKTDTVSKFLIESEITCPNCKHKEIEVMPTEVCLIKYTCKKCKVVLHPNDEDCCVFCTYGNHKCPSKQ